MEEILPTTGSSTAIPKPQSIFDPVARALEVVGDRWTLVLVRQLRGGSRGFQELRQRTGIAPRVLSGRLRELVAKGFVETQSAGNRSVYALTDEGRSLEPVVVSIGRWWIQRGLEVLGVDAGSYWSQIRSSVDAADLIDSTIKAVVFGAVIAWIAVHQGYHAHATAEGVSRATTTTVVLSSLAVLGLDFILTAVMFAA